MAAEKIYTNKDIKISPYVAPGLKGIDLHRMVLNSRTYKGQIYRKVVAVFGIEYEDLFSKKKRKPIAEARFMCFYILRIYFGWLYKKIGKEFGKDHTTIMHGVNKCKDYIKHDKIFKIKAAEVLSILN